jgi:hypothetical protein
LNDGFWSDCFFFNKKRTGCETQWGTPSQVVEEPKQLLSQQSDARLLPIKYLGLASCVRQAMPSGVLV